MIKKLDKITICVIDCKEYGLAIAAIRKSLAQVEPAKAIFLTDVKAYSPNFPFEIVAIPKISSTKEYSDFCIKQLDNYFDTEFALVIQHDGYILDAEQWDDRFLEYDYIGAAWPEPNDYQAVGNGGFSIRSKKLQHILATDDFIIPTHPEDNCICKIYRPYLEEKYGIKFAPVELADKFSFELKEPSQPTFGFHGKFHEPFKETVVIKRTGAIGDVVAVEPVFAYFHEKGYKVAIDAPLHIAMMYAQHAPYKIWHISQIDQRVNPRVIDLDMSYENNPKQLHLKSYFETAGIEDYELRNPELSFTIGDHNRLFKKYITLHIDNRDQPHRNAYGVDWQTVVAYLNDKGYTVIQVGLTEREEIKGAIWMNTAAINMLMYLIAGAEFHIGVDSGPANIAVALGVPTVVFFGSVNPEFIYPDLTNIKVIHNFCERSGCWHNVVGVNGQDCFYDTTNPPCVQFTTKQVFDALKDLV